MTRLLTILLLALPHAGEPDPAALALLDRALERMGGHPALQAIERVRFSTMTQWQRASFEALPYPDRPSYERHTDERDYTIGGWRNTRGFPGPDGEWRTITDIVRDSVAARDFGQGPAPLSIAYVDERDELFRYTPDRLVLWLRAAADLTSLADTVIAGITHARVRAALETQPVTLHLRRADGLPAMVAFTAAHPNDFGLVPWGEMDVEVWYSNWASSPEGISLPRQWDVRRFGQPYKRMTILGLTFNPDLPTDAFTIPDAVRAAYFATATRPMHDLPLDSVRVSEGNFVEFRAFGSPLGAVRLGEQWLLIEAGQAPLSLARALDWMRDNVDGGVAGALLGMVRTGNGGIAELRRRGIPFWVGRGAEPFARTMLRNHGEPADLPAMIEGPRTIRIGGEDLHVEAIDLPDARGTLLVHVPGLRWLYAPDAMTALDLGIVMERARERGWTVERVGSPRGLLLPVPGG